MSVRSVEKSHATVVENDTVAFGDIDNVEISILAVEYSIVFSIIVDIFELVIGDDLYFLRFVDNLWIDDDKVGVECLWINDDDEKEEKDDFDLHELVFVL